MLLAACFAAFVITVAADTQCPDAKPVAYYDLNAYSGVWYEAGRYPNQNIYVKHMPAVEKCFHAVSSFDGTIARIPVKFMLSDKTHFSEVDVSYVDSSKSGNITAKVTSKADQSIFEYNALILAVDYTQYALVFSCYFDESSKSTKQMFWIYTRNRMLEGNAKTEVINFIKSSGYLDFDKIIWIDNVEEACNHFYGLTP